MIPTPEYWQGYANRRQDDAIVFKRERDALQQRVAELEVALKNVDVLLRLFWRYNKNSDYILAASPGIQVALAARTEGRG